MKAPTSLSKQEQAWVDVLANEAHRDLVFLWHITGGRFGGPSYQPSELPEAIERISSALVRCGCLVGFGDPGTQSWRVPAELEVDSESKGRRIAALWCKDPTALEFLVFAQRDPYQRGSESSLGSHEHTDA